MTTRDVSRDVSRDVNRDVTRRVPAPGSISALRRTRSASGASFPTFAPSFPADGACPAGAPLSGRFGVRAQYMSCSHVLEPCCLLTGR